MSIKSMVKNIKKLKIEKNDILKIEISPEGITQEGLKDFSINLNKAMERSGLNNPIFIMNDHMNISVEKIDEMIEYLKAFKQRRTDIISKRIITSVKG